MEAITNKTIHDGMIKSLDEINLNYTPVTDGQVHDSIDSPCFNKPIPGGYGIPRAG